MESPHAAHSATLLCSPVDRTIDELSFANPRFSIRWSNRSFSSQLSARSAVEDTSSHVHTFSTPGYPVPGQNRSGKWQRPHAHTRPRAFALTMTRRRGAYRNRTKTNQAARQPQHHLVRPSLFTLNTWWILTRSATPSIENSGLAPQGRVLGASTAAPQSPGSALDRSIAALKGIADQLATTVQALHAELAGRQPVVISYSAAPSTPVSTQTFAAGQRIDNLSNTTITNPTITGGSITASSIVGTISSAISSALATIDDLTSNTITATNASFTNATTTTFYAGALSAGTASITNASTTDLATANLRVSSLNCAGYANGGTLTTDGSGNVVCATDDGTSRVGPAAIGLGRIQGLSVYPRFFASRRMLQ
jgi:hypothetical protein